MRKVRTLVVMATNRGQFIAGDQIEAIDWSHSLSHFTVIVDGGGNVDPTFGSEVDIIPSTCVPKVNLSGFMCYQGIEHALRRGIDFEYVFVLDDDALPIGKGLDEWAISKMERAGVDLFGVRDRVNYQPWWETTAAGVIRELVDVPNGFYPTGETVFFAANWMSRKFVDALFEKKLFRPNGYERWTLWPDVYISWLCQILGFSFDFAGSMEAPEIPIYANHPKNHQRWAPAPMILHPDFKLYHSIKACSGVSEIAIRSHYRDVRFRSSAE